MASLLKTLIFLTLIAIIPMAVAQSGRPLNAVETAPGTSVPKAPTDRMRPNDKTNDGTVLLQGSAGTAQEFDRDAGSSKADRKASQKTLSN